MSKTTAGAVVDVFSPTGLRSAILTNVNGDSISGFYVRNAQHYSIIEKMDGQVSDVIIVHGDERATIVGAGERQVIIFKDEDGIYVSEVGLEDRGRYVKSVGGALKVTCDYLDYFDEKDLAKSIRDSNEFYENYLSGILQENNK